MYVWAAGNDGKSHDNCNYDGYASMRYAVLIGAATEIGNVCMSLSIFKIIKFAYLDRLQ